MMIDDNCIIHEFNNGNKIIIKDSEKDISKVDIKFDDDCFNNLIVLDKIVTINGSVIRFHGSNSTIYINESKRNYKLLVHIANDSLLYIGKNCFFNSLNNAKTIFYVYEHQNIIIGDGCLVSYNVIFRTSDGHLVYDADSHKRINASRSILVGDHVWIGQYSAILKGTKIGSGSIIGGNSVVAGKKIPSNQSWAGNPAHLIRKNIYWEGTSTNKWTATETEEHDLRDKTRYVYRTDNESIADTIDSITIETLLEESRNRFCIMDN